MISAGGGLYLMGSFTFEASGEKERENPSRWGPRLSVTERSFDVLMRK